MKDLNFFEPYIEKKKLKIDKRIVSFGILTFTLLSLLAYIIYSSIMIKEQDRIVESLRITAKNPGTLKKVMEIQEKEIEVNEFRESVERIRYLDEVMGKKDIIDGKLLEIITSKMPEDLFLTSLSIYNGEIQIVGIAKDKLSIAELEKGLEDLENLDQIFISSISFKEDFYNFTININLEGVDGSGEEVTQDELEKEEP